MKANIADNDIEELHKRRYAVCKVCSLKIMINAIHGCPLQLSHLLKLLTLKEF
jgi:hypothetical protein